MRLSFVFATAVAFIAGVAVAMPPQNQQAGNESRHQVVSGRFRALEHAAQALRPADAKLLEQLRDDHLGVRIEARKSLSESHAAFVAMLMAIAEEEPAREDLYTSRHLAIELLSQIGTRDALPLFVRHIAYRGAGVRTEPMGILDAHPCGEALVRAGLSAQPAILSYLTTQPPDAVTDYEVELFANVFRFIYGPNEGGLGEAVDVVRRTERRFPNSQNVTRLRLALETLASGHGLSPAE